MSYKLLISYDLYKADDEKYELLQDKIKSLGKSVRLQESVWLVRSEKDQSIVFAFLTQFIDDKNDLILVADIRNMELRTMRGTEGIINSF